MFPNSINGEIQDKRVVDSGSFENPTKAIEVTFQPAVPAPVKIKYSEEQLNELIVQHDNHKADLLKQVDACEAECAKYEAFLKELSASK